MGDRVDVRLTILGHIETVEAFDEVLAALKLDYFYVMGKPGEGTLTLIEEFTTSLAEGSSPEFHAEGRNYGSIDNMEATLQEHGIAYAATHGAGGGYDAKVWSWSIARGELSTGADIYSNPVLDLDDVEKALDRTRNGDIDPLGALQGMIGEARLACGRDMDSFTVSEEVKRHLATLVAAKALNVEAA